MATEKKALKVPELPESVADATVLALHKKPGDSVRRDELLAELETDKVVLEVPSPVQGILQEWLVAESAVVEADAILGYLEERDSIPEEPSVVEVQSAAEVPAPVQEQEALSPPPAGPSVRRLLHEHDLPESAIRGTGPSGRILKEDVERSLQAEAARKEPTSRAAILREGAASSPPAATAFTRGESASSEEFSESGAPPARRDRRVPMTRLRSRIAERLLFAKQETAMLTTFNEVDLAEVSTIRARHQQSFEKRHETRLGFMGFFVRAAAVALNRFPIVNAEIEGNDIVYHDYVDIGIAVSSPRGLVVPVLRDADRRSIAEIEKSIRNFGVRAREGSLDISELRGGTFTITNGGVFGSLLSTPILNPPQSAILGMHAIQERPVAREGNVVIRPMMYLALSYDHRLIDGADAVSFLVEIKQLLEDPARLLLDI